MSEQQKNVPELRFPGFEDEWQEESLGNIAKVERGKFTPRPRNDPKFYNGNMPFFQTGDIARASKYVINFSQTLNDDGISVSKVFPSGTILISIAANIGDVAITKFASACPDSLVGIAAVTVNHEWLYYQLTRKKNELLSYATTNAQANINLEVLRPLKISCSDDKEQQKIATFLSIIDQKITKLREKRDLLIRYKTGVTQQLFSQKIRFRQDDGSAFPDWEEKRLGDMYSWISTNSLSREKLSSTLSITERSGIQNIHYGDIHIKFSTLFEQEFAGAPFIIDQEVCEKIKPAEFCQKGDVIIADASEDYKDIGKAIEIISVKEKSLVAGLHTYIARPKEVIMTGFSGYLFQSEGLRKNIMRIAQGVSVLGISKTNLEKISVDIPCPDEQQKISNFLQSIDKKIARITQQIEQMNTFKQGLLQKMFV